MKVVWKAFICANVPRQLNGTHEEENVKHEHVYLLKQIVLFTLASHYLWARAARF